MRGGEPAYHGWAQLVGIVLFILLVFGRAIRIRVRRRANPITLRLKKRGWLGLAEIALFGQVNLWLVAVFVYALDLEVPGATWFYGPRLLGGPVWRTAGIGLIVVGFGVFVLALQTLGESWRLGLDEEGPGQLVTHGIYRYSRNPIYLFFDLWHVGTFFANGATLFLILAILAVLNLHLQVLEEENALARIHGPAYVGYRARTPRYLSLGIPGAARALYSGKPPGLTEPETPTLSAAVAEAPDRWTEMQGPI